MRYIRAFARFLAFGLVTCSGYLLLVVSSPLVELFRGPTARWRAFAFRIWARVSATIIRMRIEVRGSPPSPPFLLVCNHLSYVDVVVLASRLDCVFVARSDVARWPVFGTMSRSVNTLFVDRDRKRDIPRAIKKIKEAMEQGPGVVLFPEGTSSNGSSVLNFKPSLLEAAARAQLPVCYASLSYEIPPRAGSAQRTVCWWGDMSFLGHMLRLFQLPSISATIEFGADSIRGSDRKVLATRLWRAVAGQFRPVAQ